MMVTPDCFHLVVQLFFIKQHIFVISMIDFLFYYILFDSFGCFATIIIVFDVRIHFGSQSNKFSDGDSSIFIFELANDFFVCGIKELMIGWII